MSEKHLAAKQQLAKELLQERKFPLSSFESTFSASSSSAFTDSFASSFSLSRQASDTDEHRQPLYLSRSLANDDDGVVTITPTGASPKHPQNYATQLASQGQVGSSCGGSFSRSDSSYSVISNEELDPSGKNIISSSQETASMDEHQQSLNQEQRELEEQQQCEKESNIKICRNRLDHLNGELERRLYQYEYLVAQEKALLGAYNMMLFANQGVNNFHQNNSQEATVDAAFSSQAGTPNRLITLC